MKPKLNRLLIATAVAAVFSVPMAVTYVTDADYSVIASAQAAQAGGQKAGGGGQPADKGVPAKSGSGRPSDKGGEDSDRPAVPGPGEDSDRPDWAGAKGGPTDKGSGGGQPPTSGIKKGDLYGDMVILLRDANGEPILTADGKVQVIAYVTDAAGNLVPLTDSAGNLVVIPYTAEGELATTVVVDGVTYNVVAMEADLGRLSVARSPEQVLDHSLEEALSKLTSGVVTVGPTGQLLVDGVAIDSPLENLALYVQFMTTGSLPGVTLPANFNPAALLAAASDKTGTIVVDTVVYINSILGINTGTDFYDFSSYQYDRFTTWKDVTAQVLVLQPDGSYLPTTVNIYDTVFASTNWTDPTASGGADDFAAAANDYLQVIEFIHDNAVR